MKRLVGILIAVLIGVGGVFSAAFAMQGASAKKLPQRLLVTFKASSIDRLEKSLPEGAVSTADIQGNTTMQSFFREHHLKRLEPLHKEHVRQRRQMGTRGVDYAATLRTRFAKRARRFKGTVTPTDFSRTYIVTPDITSEKGLASVMLSMSTDPQVESVQAERTYQIAIVPNDPYFSSTGSWGQAFPDLYGLQKVSAAGAWDLSTGTGVVVAVVDTGIDYTHPDLTANVWTNPADGTFGYNFVTNTTDPKDDNGHGTHVAGTIAAVGNNNLGVIGVAWKSHVMAVKGLDQNGSGSTAALAQGIIWATDHGADVINMSWGLASTVGDAQLDSALLYAYNAGVVLVAAAGNSAIDASGFYPANSPYVITVSAYDSNDQIAYFSDFGNKIDVAAPGVDILSLQAAGTALGPVASPGYIHISGTSMATPHVAGLAALILSEHPDYANEQVRQVLHLSADPVDGPGFNIHSGYGRINAQHALQLPLVPIMAITAPLNGQGLANNVTVTGSAGGSGFVSYQLFYGVGASPTTFTPIAPPQTTPMSNNTLGTWNTAGLSEGAYTLRMDVVTTANQTSSIRVTPLWIDHTAPTVSFTVPTDGAAVQFNKFSYYTATASDNLFIKYVEFLIDNGTSGFQVTASPYTVYMAFIGGALGAHTVTAKAVDAGGNVTSLIHITLTPPSPPVISFPSNGATLSGLVTLSGNAGDVAALPSINIEADGGPVGLATYVTNSTNWTYALDTRLLSNGSHVLTARSSINQIQSTSTVTVNVSNTVSWQASYSPTLKVPACLTLGAQCNSGALEVGRDTMISGAETNQPNTLYSSCADGSGGVYHGNESIDRVRVYTLDGGNLAPGKPVVVEAAVWAPNYSGDSLDLYYTANVSSPTWNYITTLIPTLAVGTQFLSSTYTLPSVTGIQAVRASYRYLGSPAPCTTGVLDDHDDLAFQVAVDTLPPTIPANVTFSSATTSSLQLNWSPSTDDTGVAGYRIDVSTTPSFNVFVSSYTNRDVGNATTSGVSGLSLNTTYYARVRAYDAALNVSTSSLVAAGTTLAVPPPTISISLAQGTTVFGMQEISALVTNQNPVNRVDYYIDGQFRISVTSYPYTGFLDTTAVANGPHTLSAIVYDSLGLNGVSNTLNVTVSNQTVFQDALNSTLNAWTVRDEGTISAPSAWAISGGVLNQTSPIYGTNPSNAMAKPGTMLLTGTPAWTDYSFTSQLRTGSGSIGVIFRYQDSNNYFRWSIDPDGYRRFIQNNNGSINLVTQDFVSYTPGQWLTVTVDVKSYLLRIFVNGQLAMQANVAFPSHGGIGFYTWQTTNAAFSNVKVLSSQVPDSIPPTISLQAPVNGATLSGLVTMSGTASDNQAVAQINILSDGQTLGLASGTTSWTYGLDSTQLSNGPHLLTAQATDSAGLVTSSSITVTVSNAGAASYDSTLKAPLCSVVGAACSSGGLLNGRATIAGGAEPNQPNTIYSSCADGTAGTYHSDESIDKVRVFTVDSTPLAPGKIVTLEATVWAFNASGSDILDFFYATDASSPTWTYLTSLTPKAVGIQVLSSSYTLPSGAPVQAVRANFRYAGSPAVCTTGIYDDHDDLAFRVAAAPDITSPTIPASVAFSSPTLTSLQLAWNSSTDNVAVTGYRVDVSTDINFGFRLIGYDNVSVGTTTPSLLVSGLVPATTYYARVRAYDAALNLSSNSVTAAGQTLIPLAFPVITSSTTAMGTVGMAFNYQITATNSPTSFNAAGLPAGLVISTTTGLVSGTPTTVGTSSITLSAANAGGTGTALLNLTVSSSAPFGVSIPFRMNTGGGSYTDPQSNLWQADQYFSGGSTYSSGASIAGTDKPTLYQSERYSMPGYDIPLANGTYQLHLHFAEIYFTSPGQRVFTVTAQGQTVLSNFDVYAKAGANTADMETFTVTVTNQMLHLAFSAQVNNAILSALEILPVQAPVITSPSTANGAIGTAFNYQITATNIPTSFNASGLPAGLAISTTTGLISGTPTTVGTSSITLSAANTAGIGTALLNLTVSSSAPFG